MQEEGHQFLQNRGSSLWTHGFLDKRDNTSLMLYGERWDEL
jgi:hypothetical protein